MWQFVTIDHDSDMQLPVSIESPAILGNVTHALTHRRYEFEVYTAESGAAGAVADNRPRQWVALDRLGDYPLPRPHLKIAEMLGACLARASYRTSG